MRLILALLLTLTATVAQATVAQRVLEIVKVPCRGQECRITLNPGGNIELFELAADALREAKKFLVIDGHCLSSCTLLAEKARPNVCVTGKAQFHFHQAFDIFTKQKLPIEVYSYSPDIKTWIETNGGLPRSGWLVMRSAEQKRFFKSCNERLG